MSTDFVADTIAVDFLQAIVMPGDYTLVRPIETWTEAGRKKSVVDYKGIQYLLVGGKDQAGQWQPYPQRLAIAIKRHNERAEHTKANIFFGVCPRFGTGGQYDLAWQIRVVRVLWSDVDHCTVKDALDRCKAAGLPEPSIIVASGNGVHLYWLLTEAYLIDDAGDPQPVFTEFLDQGEGKKKKVRKYLKGANGEKVYIDGKDKHNASPLSPKAQHIQDILGGIASKIGGDHTTDLSRLLRVPGTLNRKDQRNGREPIPCTLVKCDPTRRYAIDEFTKYAEASPDRARREIIAKVKLPVPRKLSPSKADRFHELLTSCNAAEVGNRSEADFALCCFGVEHGMTQESLWAQVQNVGKFREAGQRYFDRTWEKAEQQTRQKIFDKAKAKPRKKDSTANVMPEAHLTDVGNAQRLVAKYGHILRYCWAWNKWFAWDGKRWRLDEGGHVQRLAKQTVLAMYAEAAELEDKERSALIEHAQQSERASRINAMIDLARSEPGVPVLPQDLDSDNWLLNVLNGTLDLRTGQLTPHDPQQMTTKLCSVAYQPDAQCLVWLMMLDQIFMGRQSLVDYVQRFLGYCLAGSVAEQILAIFWGVGANARRLMVDLSRRLVMPKPHQSDPHGYQAGGYVHITQISTDALAAYPEAVDLAFGPYAKYGTIEKDYRNADQPGRYAPPEIVATKRRGVFGIREDEERSICTSHVERHNLTIRTLMKRFTRLSLGFSKKLKNLEAPCAMFLAYYNFVWQTHDVIGERTRLPAAMAAGVIDRLMSFEDLFDAVMGEGYAMAA